ncbi:MAG TPA: flagellar basal body rod protein FlgC [Candidatus Sulfotelmatobacter sp.]|nr:flagellar basal body rod protein FlgC [Candidatus Sulfotelmatobacter sp.]
MDLMKSIVLSASGMTAESERIKVIAENLANANSTASTPGGDPYRRKLVTFQNHLDKALGVEKVTVGRITTDSSDFELRYDPGNPAADANGYIKLPNVNSLIEMADLREAQRSYEANLSAIDAAKNMLSRSVDLLK